jgi:hypothetical protein
MLQAGGAFRFCEDHVLEEGITVSAGVDGLRYSGAGRSAHCANEAAERCCVSETKTASALRLAEIERFLHIKEAADRFAEIGIEVLDSSVFNADDPEQFKLIDFELPYY